MNDMLVFSKPSWACTNAELNALFGLYMALRGLD